VVFVAAFCGVTFVLVPVCGVLRRISGQPSWWLPSWLSGWELTYIIYWHSYAVSECLGGSLPGWQLTCHGSWLQEDDVDVLMKAKWGSARQGSGSGWPVPEGSL